MVVLVALGRHLFAADKWWQDSTLVPHLVMMETWTREMGENVLAWVMNTSS